MKKLLYFTLLLALGLVSCAREQEADMPEEKPVEVIEEAEVLNPVFHATLEGSAASTKVYTDNLDVLWNAGDLISVFAQTSVNKQYRFTGVTGDSSGDFEYVFDGSGAASALAQNYAIFPYDADNSAESENVLRTILHSQQTYRADSFGPKDNLMVAKSGTDNFNFRNVGAYLCIKLYGSGVSVHSVSLQGNNGETLAGPVEITLDGSGIPALSFCGATPALQEKNITLTAASPVALGADAEHYTTFWMVVPPVTFTQGFTITVVDSNGNVYEKSTSKNFTTERNTILSMAPFDVRTGSLGFGIYQTAGEDFLYDKVSQQMNIYERDNGTSLEGWFRFLDIPSITVWELGPIPMSIAEGDTFAATLTKYVSGEQEGDAHNFDLMYTQSYSNGILNLVSRDGYRFILRF